MCPLPLEPPPRLPPGPPRSVVTGHRVELRVLHSGFSLAILRMTVPCVLNCCRFVASVGTEKCESAFFVLHIQDCFGSFVLPYEFSVQLANFCKKKNKTKQKFPLGKNNPGEILMRIALNLCINLESIAILNMFFHL